MMKKEPWPSARPPVPPSPEPALTIQQIALRQAADWFDAYALGHDQKPGGAEKAIRNRQRATFCRLVAQPSSNVEIVRHPLTGTLCGVSKITNEVMWGPIE